MTGQVATINLMDIDSAKEHYNLFNRFKKEICKKDIDYGVIPGTKKPTLYKPGAEKLCKAFNLTTSIEETNRTIILESGFVDFEYKVKVFHKGSLVAEGIGSCNSFEDKYVFTGWKPSKENPPNDVVKKLKEEGLGAWRKPYGKKDWVWHTRSKKRAQELISIKNTIQKMAKKRAFVDGCLMATGGGEFFTQDIEDMKVSPDTQSVSENLHEVVKFALSKVSNRNELESLFNMCPSLHGESGFVSDFKQRSIDFPKNG